MIAVGASYIQETVFGVFRFKPMYLSILLSTFTAFLSGRQPPHFLWPVTLGTTQIPCPPFLLKVLVSREAFQYVAWYKVVVRRQACHYRWRTLWIAGMNSSWTVETNGDSKYVLDQEGFLQIRNVTRDDDNTFYKCVVRKQTTSVINMFRILLAVVPEEGKIIKELTD